MMENANEMVQNFDQQAVQNMVSDMVSNVEGVDDSDDFYYEEPEQTGEVIYSTNPVDIEPVQMPSIESNAEQVEETNEVIEEAVPEVKGFELTEEELAKISEAKEEVKNLDTSNFDDLFDSLYSDVTGANNFISNLIEQKKTVNINEANLVEMQEKLEKEKVEFTKFVETQKEAIELEKAQCKEFVRTQKVRIASEEAQFNADVEAKEAELSLADQTLRIGNEKLEDEKAQFASYKELEEEKLKSDKLRLETSKEAFEREKTITEEKLRTDRLKLETEKEQFAKEKEINDDKMAALRQAFEQEKEQFAKEKEIELEKISHANEELKKQEEQFAKFKELEEKKLELESKNLSQSCNRFKELVSQFNSGFQQLPGDNING